MKIDIFNHVLPKDYADAVRDRAGSDRTLLDRLSGIRALWDIEARLALLAPWPDLRQVLTLSLPTPEAVAGPDDAPALAVVANDAMAAMVKRWPERFPAFVASLPTNNVAASLEEMDRAVGKLNARGIQLITSVNGRPLDDPQFFPIFERAHNFHRIPIWLHPSRGPANPDYPTEQQSRFEIAQVLGWPHETSVAMARLVFSEFFERLPGLRVITHHCGGTVPYLVGRVEPMWNEFGLRSSNPDYVALRQRMKRRPIDYFRAFYGDTVLGGSKAALQCGIDFFGAEHVVFATDCPFGPDAGAWFVRENILAVETLELQPAARDMIFYKNALELLKSG